MQELKGNKTLSGTWAEIWYNGFKIAEATKIAAKVTVNREDVQIGMDVDTKITGQKRVQLSSRSTLLHLPRRIWSCWMRSVNSNGGKEHGKREECNI